MTKEDWIEVISTSGGRDWLDILVIAVAVISPVLVFFSVRYAAKSSEAAEKAANLSLKMYEEQVQEKEKREKKLYEFEKSKLFNSLSEVPKFIKEQDKRNFIDIYRYRYRLEEAYQSFEAVDISAFNEEDIYFIMQVKKSLKYRIDEINAKIHVSYNDLRGLPLLIEDLFVRLKK